MAEKKITIVPEEDGALVIYLGLAYRDKLYGGKIRFEDELLEDGKLLEFFRGEGQGLLDSAERIVRKLINNGR